MHDTALLKVIQGEEADEAIAAIEQHT
jgi:hypothetical protein